MPFEGVLLDLDNTLYDYERPHRAALRASIDWLADKLSLPGETIADAYREARTQINRELYGQGASHSRFLYFQRLNELLGFNPCFTVLEAEEIYWSTYLEHLSFRPHAREFLESTAHLPIAIITDLTARIQFQKLARLNIERRIAAVVSSEEAGVEKPDRRIFEMALKKLNLTADSACVIGDSWERDIKGGIALGMRCYWLKEEEETKTEVANTSSAACSGASGIDRGTSKIETGDNGRKHELVVEFKSFKELIDLMSKK